MKVKKKKEKEFKAKVSVIKTQVKIQVVFSRISVFAFCMYMLHFMCMCDIERQRQRESESGREIRCSFLPGTHISMKPEGKGDALAGAVCAAQVVFLSVDTIFPHAVLEKTSFQMLHDVICSSSSRRWNWFSSFSSAVKGFESPLNFWVKDHRPHGQCGVFLSLLCLRKVGCEFFIMLLDPKFIKVYKVYYSLHQQGNKWINKWNK